MRPAIEQAKTQHKFLFVEISPDWDISGKPMDTETLADPKVQKLLASFVRVKVSPKSVEEATVIADELGASFKFPIFCILDERGALASGGGVLPDANEFLKFLTDFKRRFSDDPLGSFEVKWNVSGSKSQTYSFILSESNIANSPVWHADNDSPPLAPRKAIQLAQARLHDITKNGWRFDSIRLQPLDAKGRWIYRVFFTANLPPDAMGGLSLGGSDTVPVLMNGYVPEAKLTHVWTRESGQPSEAHFH